MEWTEEKCMELINVYQQKDLLWKAKHPQHYNKIKKQDAWVEISQSLNSTDVEECKKKMASLLASFRREIGKIKKSRGTGTGRSDIYESSWFAFKAMFFIQDKDEPRQTLNTIAENENNSDLSSEETGAPSIDQDIQDSENVEQTASVQKLQQMVQPSVENLVRMAPPSRKPKSTKRSRTKNDERLDKAFSILEASTSAPIQDEESECQIFGKLVAKKLQGYSPDLRSIAQEELMKILFKADRGFYNNMSNQQPPPMQYPVPVHSVSKPNLYNYHYPPTVSYNSSPNLNHPHCKPLNPNEILGQTPSPATTPAPQHSPPSNYFSNFTPNTPAGSFMDSDNANSEIYETV